MGGTADPVANSVCTPSVKLGPLGSVPTQLVALESKLEYDSSLQGLGMEAAEYELLAVDV